jgi:hypothetical protein
MYTLEYRLEKAEKALKEIQADLDEKLKSTTEGNKYAVAAFIKKDPKLEKYRSIYVKLEVAKANVQRLKTKIYNKQIGLLSVARQTHKTVENTKKDY